MVEGQVKYISFTLTSSHDNGNHILHDRAWVFDSRMDDTCPCLPCSHLIMIIVVVVVVIIVDTVQFHWIKQKQKIKKDEISLYIAAVFPGVDFFGCCFLDIV